MKNQRFILTFCSLATLLFLFLTSCDLLDDPCEKTEWEQGVDYFVQPKLRAAYSNLPHDLNLKDAEKLSFSGYIRKFHCGGHWSDSYNYLSEHIPSAISDENWNAGFPVGRVYEFTFSNDEDLLECSYSLTAKFPNGIYLYTGPQIINLKPPFVKDIDSDRDYFYLIIGPSDTWEEGLSINVPESKLIEKEY